MQPATLTIHEIFEKERRYTVPLFQRAYVWRLEDQWEPLWDDLPPRTSPPSKLDSEPFEVHSKG